MDVSALLGCGHGVLALCDFESILLVGLVELCVSDRSVLFLHVAGVATHHFNCANLGFSFVVNCVFLQTEIKQIVITQLIQ